MVYKLCCIVKNKKRKDLDKMGKGWYNYSCVRNIFVIVKRQGKNKNSWLLHTMEYLRPFHRKAKRIGK